MSNHTVTTDTESVSFKSREILAVTVTVECGDGTTLEHTCTDFIGDSDLTAIIDRLKSDCIARIDDKYTGNLDTNV
jgi:hypothetical protein